MLNRLLTVLAVGILLISISHAEDSSLIIKEIKITGNKSISDSLIRSLIETKVGEEISSDKLSKDIKELVNSTGAFADVQVDVSPTDGGLIVEYRVVENPRVGSIKIVGNNSIKEKEIRDKITISPDEFLHEKTVWDNRQRILNLYKGEGFYSARVETETQEVDEGKVDLIFRINEGKRVKIAKMEITGNNGLSDRAIKKIMKTREGKHLRDSVLEEDLKRIELLYRNEGFIFVKIDDPKIEFSDDQERANITIEVNEGKRFRIGRYNLNVISPQDKRIFSDEKIRDQLTLDVGSVFNLAQLQDDMAKLQQAYYDEGYITASVTPDVRYREQEGLVDLTLNIDEGGQILIRNVEITGIEKTKPIVIKRELDRFDVKPGEPFNVANLRKARQKIISIGPFIRGVDFVPSAATGNERDLIVQITEAPNMGTFGGGGGYSTGGDGLFGFAEIGHNNLFGRAYRLYFKGEIGMNDRRIGRFTFSTPWILNTPTSLYLSVYSTQRQRYLYYYEEGDETYTDKRYGATATIGRSITRDLDVSIRLKDEFIFADVPTELQDVYQGTQKRETRSVTFYLTRDTRDYLTSMFDPSAGSLNDLSAEYAGGIFGSSSQSNQFQRYTYEGAWFLNPVWKLVVASHLKIGYLRAGPLDTEADKERQLGLIYERYFLGGSDTVRGYNDFTIVPPSTENISSVWGGNKMFYGNVELRFPIVEPLRGVLFFDIGQTWNENTDTLSGLFNDLKPRKSVGVGIRFELMGMIARLEYGFALDRDVSTNEAPEGGKFHFTIGPSF